MKLPTMDPGRPWRLGVPTLVTLLLIALWSTVTFWSLSERQRVILARENELSQRTAAIEEQTLRLFKLTEVSIQAAANWIEEHPKAFPAQASSFIKLVGEVRRVSDGMLDIRLADSNGDLYVAPSASRQPVGNVADHQDISIQLNPLTRGFYIGDPVVSRVNHKWLVPVTYPVLKPGGGLTILAVVLELDRIAGIFELQRDKQDGSITLFKATGVTLLRTPTIEGAIGKSIAKTPDFIEHLSAADSGLYRIKGVFDGVERLVSYARLPGYPLIVSVTASLDEVLTPWRDEVFKLFALILIATIATIWAARHFLRMDDLARRRLARSEQRFRSLLERAPDPTWIIEGNRFVECNEAAVKMLGHASREALLNSHPAELSPPRQPDGEDSFVKAEHMMTIATDKGLHRFEWMHTKADGSNFIAEVTLSTIELEDRQVIYCGWRDITERKLAENIAERERIRLQTILRTASDGIHILDSAGVLVEANEAFLNMLGYDHTVIGKLRVTDWDTLHSGTLVKERHDNLIARRGIGMFETRHRRRDGKLIDVEVNTSGIEIDGKGYLYAASRDITGRKQAEQQLRIAATAFESQEGMVITDVDKVILKVNHAFTEITGYTAEEAVGQTPHLLNSGRHGRDFYAALWTSIEQSGTWQGEIWNRRKSNEMYPQWLMITAVKDNAGRTTHYVGTFTDITLRKVAEDEIQNLAFYDPLTRLPNRRLLLDRLHQALASSTRSGRYGALLFIDLDNFKTINDTLGHDVGDLLLQQVAKRLATCVREGDTVARLGGDEFVVMLEDLSESQQDAAAQAETVGEKVLATLTETYDLGGYGYHGTPSIGVALFADHHDTIDELLRRADLAMYQAKGGGRNTLRFFDPEMQAAVTNRVALEAGLREALQTGQFILYYQAQVDNQGSVTGAEALLRWQHPRRGLVSPLEFISLAEETGLILPLGRWVLETTCMQLAVWAAKPETAHLAVAMNVSAREFHHRDFVDQVIEVLDRTGADPQRLKLELTESLLVADVEDTIAKMAALRAKGVRFSLDDFGTGYSSLSYLKRLPLDQLKIDRSFVRDVLTDAHDSAIARTVIALGKNLGLAVIAEGVETPEQRDFLAASGCDAYQGYLFCRPLALEEFNEFVRRN